MALRSFKLDLAVFRIGGLALAASVATFASPVRAADYSQPGPLTTTVQSFNTSGANGKVAYPTNGSGPFPTLVLGHGALFANADQQIGWGEHFASYGFVAVAVNLGSFPDGNGGTPIIQAALNYLDSAPAPLAGLADTANFGLEGFSAGGQSFAVAAVGLKPGALVLFDPVGGSGMGGGTDPGGSAVPNICSPTITIFTEPSTCNSNSNWSPFALSSSGPRATLRITGATHCDGENADRGGLCGGFCGGAATPAKQSRFAHYGTAWFLAYLKGNAEALAEVTDSALGADSAIKNTGTADGPDCDGNTGNGGSGGAASGGAGGAQGGTDAGGAASGGGAQGGSAGNSGGPGGSGVGGAGADGGTAGSSQAGSSGSGQGGSQAGSSGAGGAAGGDDSGCSCRASGAGSTSPLAAALFGMLGLALLRRRRSRGCTRATLHR
ncbi:MAG: MYXO-CTERM sorting domain-containing protein [Polyangiaceae bacterium]|nr:MYXO-CTERM sorting domain-containing protein [Polyangiaceae bacterium]